MILEMRYSRTLFVKIFLPCAHCRRCTFKFDRSSRIAKIPNRDRIQSYSAGTTRYRTTSRLFGARKMKKGDASGKAADTFIRTDVAVASTRSSTDPLCMLLSNLLCIFASDLL